MESEKVDKLKSRVMDDMREKLMSLREHAEHFAHQQVEKMVATEEVLELSEDEERLLRAYRAFTARNASGVFSWTMPEDKRIVTEPPNVSLIRDPREASTT